MSSSFRMTFFRLYDRKIASGEITFNQTGIRKHDFTKLCVDQTFVLPREEVERLCVTMKLTQGEAEELLASLDEEE